MPDAKTTVQEIVDNAKLSLGDNLAPLAFQMLKDARLTPEELDQFKALVSQAQVVADTAFVREQPPVGGRIDVIRGHKAVVDTVLVGGRQLITLLSEETFDKTRSGQIAYAAALGFRFATREEHLTYVKGLLSKEVEGSLSEAEEKALTMYKNRFVCDADGGIVLQGTTIVELNDGWRGPGIPFTAAMCVYDPKDTAA